MRRGSGEEAEAEAERERSGSEAGAERERSGSGAGALINELIFKAQIYSFHLIFDFVYQLRTRSVCVCILKG